MEKYKNYGLESIRRLAKYEKFPRAKMWEKMNSEKCTNIGGSVALWQLPFLERLLRSRKVFLTVQMGREIKTGLNNPQRIGDLENTPFLGLGNQIVIFED